MRQSGSEVPKAPVRAVAPTKGYEPCPHQDLKAPPGLVQKTPLP